MKNLFKRVAKKFLAFYVVCFPIKINDYWFYMSPYNIELIPYMLIGKYETGMTKLIRRIVNEGATICDVGTYIGYHTTLFSKLSGKYGKVINIEPQPNHYKLLQKNIALNKLKNVYPLNVAISDKEGFGKIYTPEINSPDSRVYKVKGKKRSASKIRLETLDNLLKDEEKVDLIKIDIQGWEERAIKGARETILKNPHLFLVIEFWPKGLKEAGTNPLKLLGDIKKFGFKIYKINEASGNLKLETNFSQLIVNTEAGDGGYIDLLCSRKDIWPNFEN